MENSKELLIEERTINKMWLRIYKELEFGKEEFDVDLWKNCIKRTYYFFYNEFEETMINKKYLNILLMMHSIRMFPVMISEEFMAAQLVTEALLENIAGNAITYMDDIKIDKGKLIVDGRTIEDIFYIVDVDNINLDEIIIGERYSCFL